MFHIFYPVILSIQIIILAFGYGFLGAVLYYGYLSPPDQVNQLCLFTISVKAALRHRMSWGLPVSLAQLTAGVALSKGSYILSAKYWQLTTLTLWTTLLTPTYFLWPIEMQGSELDITGTAFSTLLSEEFQNRGLNYRHTYGLPGTFNFNGAKYDISTQGIVPVIEDYSGSDGVPDTNGTRLGFSGGNVTVNTRQIQGKHTIVHIPQGFSRNYTMLQQGLTANVSCQAIDSSQTQYVWNTNDSSVIYANAAASNHSITGLRLWNISANCGTRSKYLFDEAVVTNSSLRVSHWQVQYKYRNPRGLTRVLVIIRCTCKFVRGCPEPNPIPRCLTFRLLARQTYSSTKMMEIHLRWPFTVISQGFYKYRFLNPSVCTVVPLLTTVHANYSHGLISSKVVSVSPFRPENLELLSFVAGVAKFHSINSQGLTSSTIGDTLYTIYSSTTNTSIDDGLETQTQVYEELFLRSGFMVAGSFPDNTIPDELLSPVNGTMYISTIGWTRRSATYLLAILPVTTVIILTFACALYSKDSSDHRITFDVSDTLHLMMASAAGNLTLEGFNEKGSVDQSVKVRLDGKDMKKLVKSD
ncbi:hypothetical protein BDR04DRAFT_1117606 [Suillus decipiens]|nr:hypothetical protein BDR04DRAFT_1117606 [Suillus decipiens]